MKPTTSTPPACCAGFAARRPKKIRMVIEIDIIDDEPTSKENQPTDSYTGYEGLIYSEHSMEQIAKRLIQLAQVSTSQKQFAKAIANLVNNEHLFAFCESVNNEQKAEFCKALLTQFGYEGKFSQKLGHDAFAGIFIKSHKA